MPIAEFPHCNTEVLHAPGTCEFCDEYPDRQAMRAASETPFTPAEANGWYGNVAQPVRLAAHLDTNTGIAALLRHHGVKVEFDQPSARPKPPPNNSWMTTANGRCAIPQPHGWRCRRYQHPPGTPCAAIPRWWNWRARWAMR